MECRLVTSNTAAESFHMFTTLRAASRSEALRDYTFFVRLFSEVRSHVLKRFFLLCVTELGQVVSPSLCVTPSVSDILGGNSHRRCQVGTCVCAA